MSLINIKKIMSEYLILDTSSFIRYLRSKISNLIEFNANEEKILILILESISNSNTAIIELEYSLMAIIHDSIGMLYEQDIEIITSAILNLGKSTYSHLQLLKAYVDGSLIYRYYGMLNDDIILKRY